MNRPVFRLAPLYRAISIGLLCLPVLLLSNSVNSKDFYKWQDDDGVTNYSAHPPRNERAAQKVRATNLTGAAAAKPASKAETKTETAAAEQAVPSKKNSERCAAAQKNLKTLQERARVRIKEGDSFRYLSPEEKQDMEKSTRKQIEEAC